MLDVGWELGQVMAGDGWVRRSIARAATTVAVTAPTVPGLRRLETALTLLRPSRVLIAVVGAPARRWPGHLAAVMGPQTRAAQKGGHLLRVPCDKDLPARGLDAAPLSASLLQAAHTLLRHTTTADQHRKGQPV